MKIIKFKLKEHHGEAVIVDNYNEGTIYILNNLPGKMNDLETNRIGEHGNYAIFENHYSSDMDCSSYFAVKQL